MRILVEHLHVAVGGCAVQVEVVFLDVLAVVAFGAGQAVQPLLEDRVVPVPQRQGEAQVLGAVADPGQAVLVPAVRPAAGIVVREVVPGRTVVAVVFAYRAPRPLAEVGPPLLPVGRARLMGGEALMFSGLSHVRLPLWQWLPALRVPVRPPGVASRRAAPRPRSRPARHSRTGGAADRRRRFR